MEYLHVRLTITRRILRAKWLFQMLLLRMWKTNRLRKAKLDMRFCLQCKSVLCHRIGKSRYYWWLELVTSSDWAIPDHCLLLSLCAVPESEFE